MASYKRLNNSGLERIREERIARNSQVIAGACIVGGLLGTLAVDEPLAIVGSGAAGVSAALAYSRVRLEFEKFVNRRTDAHYEHVRSANLLVVHNQFNTRGTIDGFGDSRGAISHNLSLAGSMGEQETFYHAAVYLDALAEVISAELKWDNPNGTNVRSREFYDELMFRFGELDSNNSAGKSRRITRAGRAVMPKLLSEIVADVVLPKDENNFLDDGKWGSTYCHGAVERLMPLFSKIQDESLQTKAYIAALNNLVVRNNIGAVYGLLMNPKIFPERVTKPKVCEKVVSDFISRTLEEENVPFVSNPRRLFNLAQIYLKNPPAKEIIGVKLAIEAKKRDQHSTITDIAEWVEE
jgi:hypothetical protein